MTAAIVFWSTNKTLTAITCKKITLQNYRMQHTFEVERKSLRIKNKTFFVSRPPTCWKLNSSFWRLNKNKWTNKIKIITKLKLYGVCKTPLTNPCQICTHWFASFSVDMIIFLGFQDFLIYLARYFWLALMFFAEFFSNFSQG